MQTLADVRMTTRRSKFGGNHPRTLSAALLTLGSAVFFTPAAVAQSGQPWIEWEQRQNADQRLTAFGPDLLGDQIDPNTGALVFEHADVVLPGNSQLDVSLRRRLSQGYLYDEGVNAEFGNWEYLVPRIVAITRLTGWTGSRCSNSFATSFPQIPQAGSYPVQQLQNYEYSNGVKLEVPGAPSQQLLESPLGAQWPAGRKYTTTENWYFTCITAVNGGQGFLGYAPNGNRYRFDRYINRPFRPLGVLLSAKSTGTPRSKSILAATEVTDVNGNWVRYDYDTSGRLTRIHSNDGRQIDLTYQGTSKLVSQVRANPNGAVRTWTYSYRNTYGGKPYWEGGGSINIQSLGSVTQPDGRSWTLNLDGMFAEPTPGECATDAQQLQIIHPYGVTGTFWLTEARHRQGLHVTMQYIIDCPGGELLPPSDPNPPWVTAQVDTMSVYSKHLDGPGISPATWSFQYEFDDGPPGSSASDPTNTAIVVQPDGSLIHYYHRWQEGDYGGLLVKRDIRQTSGSPLLEMITYAHVLEAPVGSSFAQFGSYSRTAFTKIRPSQTVVSRGSDTYTSAYVYDSSYSSSTYSFGYPTQVTETSTTAPSLSRVTSTVYLHDKTLWVIGLPTSITRNGALFDSYTYDSLRRVSTRSRFGSPRESYTYSSTAGQQGTVATFANALNNTYTVSSWKRGKPQLVQRPDGTTFSRIVDDNGWVTSETDGRLISIGFAYNPMGWLTFVDRPSNFADTATSYSGYGVALEAVSTRGTQRTTISYDAMLRPTLAKSDATNGSVWPIYERISYDIFGRETFKSWPSASAWPTQGVTQTYDALSRLLSTVETVAPYATTTTEYLSAGQTRVTDQVGAQVTTTSRAFGTPAKPEVIQVVDPLGTVTSMTRDIYGNVTQLTQSGTQNGYYTSVTRQFWYDTNLRLCRHRAPEFGDELFAYDALDRVQYSSRGEAPASGCATPSSAIRTAFTYDSRGRLTNTDFPSTTPDIVVTYDENSNKTSVSRGGVNWTYAYNSLDLLTQEKLVIEGRTYQFDYGYDTNGRITSRGRAGGPTLAYAPDALGRPTGIAAGGSNYLHSVGYHPNGLAASGSHGNGQVFAQSLDARQRPLELSTARSGGPTAVWRLHGYDPRGKLTSLTDYLNAAESRSFAYDAKGRLVAANGPWGVGSFMYDALDNLRAQTLGNRAINVYYDSATNRVSSASDAGVSRPYGYDARGNGTTVGNLGLVYDFANQPLLVSGGTSATYIYDGNLKRVKSVSAGKTVYSVYSALGGSVIFRDEVTDGKAVDYASVGPLTVRLINGANPEYTHADHLGSPIAATNAAGAINWRESYNPYGEARLKPAANADNTGYTGHVQDAATGLTYMQARYYDPVIGRFLAPDPIGYQDGLNLYAYVGNDPVNGTDPSGMYECGDEKGAACNAAREGRAEVTKARDFYAARDARTGEVRNPAAAKALGQILDTLGTENDGNGLTVQAGEVQGRPEALGGYKDGVITLNTDNIAKSRSLTGTTLAHEVQHKRQESLDLRPVYTEVQPKGIGYLVNRGNGISFVPGWSAEQTIKWSLTAYCPSVSYCTPIINRAYQVEMGVPFR